MKRGAKINVSEFAAYLEVPVSDPLADMFSLFDEVAHHPVGVGVAKPSTSKYTLFSL